MTTQPDIFTDFETIIATAEAASFVGVTVEDVGDDGTFISVPCPYSSGWWATIKLTGTTRTVTNHAQGDAAFEASNESVVNFLRHAAEAHTAETARRLVA